MQTHYYEGMFIISPDDDNDDSRNRIIEEITAEIKKQKGKIASIQPMGKKQLTYSIKGKSEGYYYLLYFESDPQSIQKMKDRFKINPSILRELILRIAKQSEFIAASSKTLQETSTDTIQKTEDEPPRATIRESLAVLSESDSHKKQPEDSEDRPEKKSIQGPGEESAEESTSIPNEEACADNPAEESKTE